MTGKQQALSQTASFAIMSDEVRERIESSLEQHLPLARARDNVVFDEALQYAVFPGGRRLRAVLALLASEVVLADNDDALTAAVAVEYLHTSALIFDDLPAMDDARERRGRACLHLRYGEGLATVVALALMNAAYGIVVSRGPRVTSDGRRAFRELTECIGAQIIGQAADLTAASTRNEVDRSVDASVRHWKTSALLRLALTLGPILSGANSGDVAALSRFGQLLGEAYQTVDDSRDIDEDRDLLWRGREATFAMQYGCEPARQRAAKLTAEAQHVLMERFGDLPSVYRLCEFANQLA